MDITKIEENQRNFEIDHLIKKFNSKPSTPFLPQLDDLTSYDTQVTMTIYLFLTLIIALIIYWLLPPNLKQKVIEFVCCCLCTYVLCRKRSKKKKQRALIKSLQTNLHQAELYSTNNSSFNSTRYRPISSNHTTDLNSAHSRSQSQSCSILNTSMPHALQDYSLMNPLSTQNQYHPNLAAIPLTYQPPTNINHETYPTSECSSKILKNKSNKSFRIVPYTNHPRSPKNLNNSSNSSDINPYAVPKVNNHPTEDLISPPQKYPDYQSPSQEDPQDTLPQPLNTSSPKLIANKREPLNFSLPPPIPKIPPPTSPDSPPPVPEKLRPSSPEELVFKVSFTETNDPEDPQHNN